MSLCQWLKWGAACDSRVSKIIGVRGGCDNMEGVGLQMKFMRYGIGGAGCELSNPNLPKSGSWD